MEVRPTYGHTDVRVVPEGWKLKRLGDVVVTLPSGIYGNEKSSDGLTAMPVATTAHISENDSWNGKEMQQRFFTPNQIVAYSVKKGDLVVVKSSGSAASIKSGKIGLVDNEQAGTFVFSNFLMTLRPISVQSRYLYFYLTSHSVKKLLPSLVEASTYPNLRINEYLSIEVPIPEEQEQAAIAKALGDADALIESLEQLVAKQRQLKQGSMQELLTGKKRLPGFRGDWESKPLKNVIRIPVTDGPHLTPRFLNDGVPFLSVNNLVDNRIDVSSLRYISREDHAEFSRKCRPLKGDVLLGKAASVGRVAIVDIDMDFNIWSPIALIRVSNDNIPRFVYYSFQTETVIRQIELLTNSSSQGNIGMGDIERLVLLLPEKEEQQAIADILSDIDTAIAALEAQLAKARQLKQGMMQELLTGRIRLV